MWCEYKINGHLGQQHFTKILQAQCKLSSGDKICGVILIATKLCFDCLKQSKI